MGIYAKKNAKGQPTGKWTVELMIHGERQRRTANSLVEARQIEASMKLGEAVPKMPVGGQIGAREPETAYNVAWLFGMADTIYKAAKDRKQSVARLQACCEILGSHTPLMAVRTIQLDGVVKVLEGRGLGANTIHRYLSAISGGLRYCLERDIIAGMPRVPWPAATPGKTGVLQDADEAKLIGWLEEFGHDDVALIYRVLLATGCRIGELVGGRLSPHHVNVSEELLTFQDTKNGDNRTVYLEAGLAVKLRELAERGVPNYRKVNNTAQRAARALGIEYSVTPHVMRHTVGTRLGDSRVHVKTIAEVLGHRSIRTSEKYIHPGDESKRQALKAIAR